MTDNNTSLSLHGRIIDACKGHCPCITFLRSSVKFTWFEVGADEGCPMAQLVYTYCTDTITATLSLVSPLPDPIQADMQYVTNRLESIFRGIPCTHPNASE